MTAHVFISMCKLYTEAIAGRRPHELQPVDKTKYKMFQLKQDYELVKFLGDKYRSGCAYYEFVNDKEDITIGVKIILVDKVR